MCVRQKQHAALMAATNRACVRPGRVTETELLSRGGPSRRMWKGLTVRAHLRRQMVSGPLEAAAPADVVIPHSATETLQLLEEENSFKRKKYQLHR